MKTENYVGNEKKDNLNTLFLISGVLALLLTIIAVYVAFSTGSDFTLSDFFIRVFGQIYIGLLYAIKILGGIFVVLSVIVGLLFASDYIRKFLFTIHNIENK